MIKKFSFLCIFIIFLTLIGCSSAPTKAVIDNITPTPAPAAGKAIFFGQVINSKDGIPLGETPVRLAQVYRQGEEGAYVLDMAHSPSSISDKDGNFLIIDITPAEYLIVIGSPDDNHYIIYQDGSGKPITFQIEANKSTQVGEIKVDFKPQ